MIRKNNNSARASRFFVHFFSCRHCTKVVNFTSFFFCFLEDMNTRQRLSFCFPVFSWTSIESFKIQLKKSLPPTFDELNELEYKSKKFEAAQNSLNSLFDVFFSRRCRYCALYSWVARDVTKNQTKKLSILLSFYFHQALQYLNTFT